MPLLTVFVDDHVAGPIRLREVLFITRPGEKSRPQFTGVPMLGVD